MIAARRKKLGDDVRQAPGLPAPGPAELAMERLCDELTELLDVLPFLPAAELARRDVRR